MATKPTERIPDWASGGTRTDPGAGKEASGWAVSERPPAQWWNWILGAIGDWLTWSETSIDDIEAEFPPESRTRAMGAFYSPGGSVDTPVIATTTHSFGIDTPQSGDVTSTDITVRFSTAFADTEYLPTLTQRQVASGFVITCVALTTTTLQVKAYKSTDGSVVNPLTTTVHFFLDVKGAQ